MSFPSGDGRGEYPLARLRTESKELVLPLGRTAMWTFQDDPGQERIAGDHTGILRLRGLDGTLRREWRDAIDDDPSASTDGSMLLVRLQQGWTLFRGESSDVVLSPERIAIAGLGLTGTFPRWGRPQLSPDGRRIAVLERTPMVLELQLRLLDLETKSQQLIAPVRACQCGFNIAPNWLADGAAFIFGDARDSRRLLRYDIASGSIAEMSGRRELLADSDPGTGVFSDWPLGSPDGSLIAAFEDHRVVVRTAGGAEIAKSTIEIAWLHLEGIGPNLQWDATGRYLVAFSLNIGPDGRSR
jgi:hypothetical protein